MKKASPSFSAVSYSLFIPRQFFPPSSDFGELSLLPTMLGVPPLFKVHLSFSSVSCEVVFSIPLPGGSIFILRPPSDLFFFFTPVTSVTYMIPSLKSPSSLPRFGALGNSFTPAIPFLACVQVADRLFPPPTPFSDRKTRCLPSFSMTNFPSPIRPDKVRGRPRFLSS